MRSDPTLGERILWWELRRSNLGVRFRRQDAIGNAIADFTCRRRRLVIEVDGDSHDDPGRDERRYAELRRRGWRVLRFWDDELLTQREMVLSVIWEAVHGPDRGEDPRVSPPRAGEMSPEATEGE